jgi:hypothetical protein
VRWLLGLVIFEMHVAFEQERRCNAWLVQIGTHHLCGKVTA